MVYNNTIEISNVFLLLLHRPNGTSIEGYSIHCATHTAQTISKGSLIDERSTRPEPMLKVPLAPDNKRLGYHRKPGF